ncbi:hypothetical protein INT44_007108 [Umbelopsis vinacea]|uniref:Bromo domain-containing protein n=1 Tax=Umbelopsis vinacea TaxID=44442 RepID=A0A8H7PGG9_9FUNG|nr:hypothetical protein INT44_007108 [Umbelopsis vinacea]
MNFVTDSTVNSSQNHTQDNESSQSMNASNEQPVYNQPMDEQFTESNGMPLEPTVVHQSTTQPSLDTQPNDPDNQQPAAMSKEQWQWCTATLKNLKKNKSAGPFLEPVDIVKFNIPHYPDLIKHPMDLGTVQAKVNARQYSSLDRFIADVRLIFTNCYTFNGVDSPVSAMAAEVEKAFDRAVYKKPSAPAPVPKKVVEPPAKVSKKEPKVTSAGLTSDERKRCRKALDEMKKPAHNAIAWPFLLPVDPVAWNIIGYFDVVKHPMDISTVEKKLNAGEYNNVAEFEADVRLIFHNCYIFNTPDNEVYQMGQALEAVFNERWHKMAPVDIPAPPPVATAAATPAPKKVMSAKEKRIEQLEAQLRRLKEQLNEQQEIQEAEDDDDDDEFKDFTPAPSKRVRSTSRRLTQDSDDDTEFVPKKRRTSKSFPTVKQDLQLSPPPAPVIPAKAPALSKSPPISLASLSGNRPKLALGATLSGPSPPPEKDQEKKPEIVLQNEDKWLALMRADGGSQASSQTAGPTGVDSTTPSANTSPAQDNQKVDPLWQKFQEERRLREENEREARELVKRKEKERKEEEIRLMEQLEAAKRAKEEAERERRRTYHRQLQEETKLWTVDLYKQKRIMERFERECWADNEWRDEMKRQQEAAESRRVIMPAFTLSTGLTLDQVKQAILHHRDHYEQRKLEHGDERIVDMDME